MKGFKFIQAVIVIACMLLISCKTQKDIVKINPMNNNLYTQEGKLYLVKTASKNLVNENIQAAFAGTLMPAARINLGDDPILITNSLLTVIVNTDKSVIPVSLSVSIKNVTTGLYICDITSVYFSMFASSGALTTRSYKNQSSSAKLYPFTERIYYTNNMNYQYSTVYNQAFLSDTDFMNCSEGAIFVGVPSISRSITESFEAGDVFSLTTDDYDISVNFVYLELQ